jgi:hypothetical protein
VLHRPGRVGLSGVTGLVQAVDRAQLLPGPRQRVLRGR